MKKIFHYLDEFRRIKFKTFNTDISDTIVVVGSPRSGTTWLMNILSEISGYSTIFEPMHYRWFPETRDIGFYGHPYIPADQDWPKMEEYLSKVLKGQVSSYELHVRFRAKNNLKFLLKDLLKRVTSDKVVVKFVRANRLLPWMVKKFPDCTYIYIIRHPCAVISSQIKNKISSYLVSRSNPYDYLRVQGDVPKELIFDEVQHIPILEKNIIKKLKLKVNSLEETLALIWSLDNWIPLSHPKPMPWYTVIYENLINDWEGEITRIFNHIGKEIPENINTISKRPSATAIDTSSVGTRQQLEKWKKNLSKKKIDNILNISRMFGLDFYNENPEPKYDEIRHWNPQNLTKLF